MKHGGDAGFLTVIWFCSENRLEHALWAGGVFDDTTLRSKIAAQNGDAAISASGVIEAVDDVLSADRDA